MKKKWIKVVVLCFMFINALVVNGNSIQAEDSYMEELTGFDTTIYKYDQTSNNTQEGRLQIILPTYLVYPDQSMTKQEAEELVVEMGLKAHVDDYTTQVYVMNPKNGTVYTNEDVDVYKSLVSALAPLSTNNIKVIGIGNGATFVNNELSKNAYAIAGIMSYGGDVNADVVASCEVPVYIANSTSKVTDLYKAANNSTVETSDSAYTIFTNADNELKRTVVASSTQTKKEAFEAAWKSVFSKNYRWENSRIEFYKTDVSTLDYPLELVSYPMFDELGVQVNTVYEDFTGNGDSLWHEYIPQSTTSADEGTIPLVLLFHGQANDNRTQPETSGWVEVAAKEGFICVAPEWQGTSGYAPISSEEVIDLISLLKEKYPQIDMSRIYTTGLSAGAMRSYELSLTYPEVFAGVAAHSAPFAVESLIDIANDNYEEGRWMPIYIVCGDNDEFSQIPVTAEGFAPGMHFYNAVRAFGAINNIEVSETPDLSLNQYYGAKTDNTGWTKIGEIDAYTGTLSNQDGEMMKLVALTPYAHFNYKPTAAEMWDFIGKYAKDQETGKTIDLSKSVEELDISGLPETIYVGDTFVLTPSVDDLTGKDGWEYDEVYFDATFNSPATFTAKKAGTTSIQFTASDGQNKLLEVDILEKKVTTPTNPVDKEKPSKPAEPSNPTKPSVDGSNVKTGDTTNSNLLLLLAFTSLVGIGYMGLKAKNKKQ